MQIRSGYEKTDQRRAAELYWEAFGDKLGRVLGPDGKALDFFERVMRPDHAISAYGDDGSLLGIVGFKTSKGALAGGTFADLRSVYGLFGAAWRALLLSLLERDTENESFLMDGIFVAPLARGQGVGEALLRAVKGEAEKRGYQTVRLDVIDTNDRARALYERNGFVEVGLHDLGLLHHVFRFRRSTKMISPALVDKMLPSDRLP